jgi:hypothetical protein
MAVQLASAMMATAGKKESPIAVRAAIRVLKHHMVKEPIFEAAASGAGVFPATTMGTPRD